jgi:hypothetical protein
MQLLMQYLANTIDTQFPHYMFRHYRLAIIRESLHQNQQRFRIDPLYKAQMHAIVNSNTSPHEMLER